MEWKKGELLVSTDKTRLSLDTICHFLINRSYWAKSRTREQISKSIEKSVCFGVYDGERQIAFARVVTDYSVMYWLCDVFVDEEYRGKGIGKYLVDRVVNHPELEGLNGVLATRDAQGLYERFGFAAPPPAMSTFMGKRKVPLTV
ncbi:MAG: GNAT family N-acetyltransferase [Pseudomonadota bacterium]